MGACSGPRLATGSSPTDPATPASADQDVVLAAQISGAVAHALVLAVAVGRAHRPLRPWARDLAAVHRAHAAVLPDPDVAPGAVAVPPTVRAARTALEAAEEHLRGELVGAAMAARSGPLARVLASMNAGLVPFT